MSGLPDGLTRERGLQLLRARELGLPEGDLSTLESGS